MPADEESKPQGGLPGQPHGDAPEVSPPLEGQQNRTGMAIKINGNRLEPESQMPGGDLFEETASKTNYIIIQFTELPDDDQEKQLDDLQVQFCRKIPPYTWLARYEPHDLSPLRELPFVVFANPYHDSLSLGPALESLLAQKRHTFAAAVAGPSKVPAPVGDAGSGGEADGLMDVIISLHPSSRMPAKFREYLVSNHSIPSERIFLNLTSVTASLTPEQVFRISKIDDVAEVHLAPELVTNNHLVGGALRMERAEEYLADAYPGLELDGKGQIIAIADTGLDYWKMAAPGFLEEDKRHPFFKGRIIYLDMRAKDEAVWDGKQVTRDQLPFDYSGHGTHVAGIALGSYDQMKYQPEMGLLNPRLDGVAPKAELIMQNIWGLPKFDPVTKKMVSVGGYKVPNNDLAFHTVFLDPYYGYPSGGFQLQQDPRDTMKISYSGSKRLPSSCPHGARIHNSSWGVTLAARMGYGVLANIADETVYLVPDYLLVTGAGNEGDVPDTQVVGPDGQIMGLASAKNVLTVGACYNHNQYIRTKADPSPDPKDPPDPHPHLWASFQKADDGGRQISSENIARLSSRGPPWGFPIEQTPPLIKPDVVAPGMAIYSSKSRRDVSGKEEGTAPIPHALAKFDSGTSMAAPVVSGAAALIRQALAKRGGPFLHPSAALMKALIVQGAVDLSTATTGGKLWPGNDVDAIGSGLTDYQDIPPAPNDIQGWGRLDVAESIFHVVNTTTCAIIDAQAPDGGPNSGRTSTSPSPPDLRLDPKPNDLWHSRSWQVVIPRPAANSPLQRGNIRATLCWTDVPAEMLQNQLALSISVADNRKPGVSVDPRNMSGNQVLYRMAWNNVQRLEIRDIDMTLERLPMMIVKVAAVRLVPNLMTRQDEKQAYALVWKIWYT